jgi:hypothetical protein
MSTSDRLLELIKKGVTVSQVAQVTNHFTQSGIMVHAYLMYGFPTQTAQETIDSLEMVRQLIQAGVIQSGFWHRFAMTAHSPVGLDPKSFGAINLMPMEGSFANNDLPHEDPTGANHELYGEGLRKSLFNYMHGVCFDVPLQEWFDTKVPKPSVSKSFIANEIKNEPTPEYKDRNRILWIGAQPELQVFEEDELCELIFSGKKEDFAMELPLELGEWVAEMLSTVGYDQKLNTLKPIRDSYEATLGDFEEMLESEVWEILREQGLLVF